MSVWAKCRSFCELVGVVGKLVNNIVWSHWRPYFFVDGAFCEVDGFL